MSKKIGGDMRKPKQAPNKPGLLLQGKFPFMPNKIILTDEEKADLDKIGWKEGDPIPTNLPDYIASLREEATSFQPPVPLDTPPLEPPREQSIDDLPPGKREELTNFMKQAKLQAVQYEKAQRSQIPNAGQGVNEAIRAGVVDIDNENYVPGVSEGVKNLKKIQKSLRGDRQVEEVKEKEEEPIKEDAGGNLRPTHCSHCGWDQSVTDDLPVEDADKYSFMVSILGQKRFRKTVSLLGGQLAVGFRALTAKEADMAYRQIVIDAMGDIQSESPQLHEHYWRNLQGYRLVMGLEFIESKETGRIDIDEVGSILVDDEVCPPPNTPLVVFYKQVIDNALPTESLRRIVGTAHHRFQLAAEKLEVKVDDPNFWGATAKQP